MPSIWVTRAHAGTEGARFRSYFIALLHAAPRILRGLSLPFLDGSMPFHSFVTPIRWEAGHPNGTGLALLFNAIRYSVQSCNPANKPVFVLIEIRLSSLFNRKSSIWFVSFAALCHGNQKASQLTAQLHY